MSTATALKRVEALRVAIDEAERHLEEVKLKRRQVAGTLDRSVAPLRAYYEGIASGEKKRDPALEQKLTDELYAARAGGLVRSQPIYRDGKLVDVQVVDERVEAELAGAHHVKQVRINERIAFVREHADDLKSELLERAHSARDGLDEGREALEAAAGEWQRVRNWWSELIAYWDLAPDELPRHNPFAGAIGELGRTFAPMASGVERDTRRLVPAPASLLEEG